MKGCGVARNTSHAICLLTKEVQDQAKQSCKQSCAQLGEQECRARHIQGASDFGPQRLVKQPICELQGPRRHRMHRRCWPRR